MAMTELPPTPDTGPEIPTRQPVSPTLGRLVKYILVKGITIAITIFVGVFITVVLANRGGAIDNVVAEEVSNEMDTQAPGWRWDFPYLSKEDQAQVLQWQQDLEEAAGLHLPYWPRQFVWTLKALQLDWRSNVRVASAPGSSYHSFRVTDIILTDLPHTLLLVGTAFFLLFSLGIPLSLFLFRVQGSWFDRLMTVLTAVTPVPSWVFGILLILIFAVGLRLLPPGGMYDTLPGDTKWETAGIVFKHMVIPVTAILLSLFLQCIYAWRTFFLLFAEEDYVELARAKGLSNRVVERKYILRPTMPYILTNFAILLVSFWQMTIALEKVINWPGIGRLYILTLPNFWGESFYPGVMPMTLGIVVLFAYLLGITVFLLDIVYALVDPRVRIGGESQTLKAARVKGRGFWSRLRERWKQAGARSERPPKRTLQPVPPRAEADASRPKTRLKSRSAARSVFREIFRYPSAVFGMVVVLLLIAGSLYAVIAYPYTELGSDWYTGSVSGKVSSPRVAQPAWTNYFRQDQLPPMIIMNSRDGTATKTVEAGSNGLEYITLTYTFEFPYGEFPQDIIIYFEPEFTVKQPFAILTWITPDGREFEIGKIGTPRDANYTVMDGTYIHKLLLANPPWKNWFVDSGNYPTPAVNLLFADPASDTPSVLKGTYSLRVDGITFEDGADLDAQMVLIGQVYGVAGTDYHRRDLLVPLLWGMPFALVFGLLGACVTTVLSMALAATGVWFGGWVDNLIQRLVEANMILPVIGIAVLIYSYFNVSIWTLLWIVVLLNVFGSPIKSFRAALLQVRDSPYIEAAKAYGAGNTRIIFRYLVPRIIPTLIPQLVILIPAYVFLEATLGIFNVYSIYPTWGRIIYEALRYGGSYGSGYWVLEPIGMLLLTGLAFSMLGFALERILNPRILEV
jgi:peptide/nickel transport system permease protein